MEGKTAEINHKKQDAERKIKPESRNTRILIVDDEEYMRDSLSELLLDMGFEVAAAGSGAEALQKLEGDRFDIALLDIKMPGLDGLELLDRIRKKRPRLDVVMLTGYATVDNAIKSVNLGAYDFLRKPFDNEELRASIKRLLEKRTLEELRKQTEEELRRSHYELETRVQERTAELRLLNEQLKLEIEEKREMEKALQKSEERYRRITGAVTDYIFTVRMENGRPLETVHSPACFAVTGYTSEDYASDPNLWIQMVHEEDREAVLDQANRILSGKDMQPVEHRILRKDGVIRWVKITLVPHYDTQGRLLYYDGLIRDITERKQAEEALKSSEARLRTIIENNIDGVVIVDETGVILFANPAAEAIFDCKKEELMSNLFGFQVTAGKTSKLNIVRKEKEVITIEMRAVEIEWKDKAACLVLLRDITEHEKAKNRIEQHLRYLSALREIDMAISGSFDLRVTLNVVLSQVTAQLGVDAAIILLLNPNSNTLEYAAGRGFRSSALQHTILRLGEGHAGRAALEQRIVSIPNLAEVENGFRRSPLLPNEGFIFYSAMPLIAKGHVRGVMEIFHRSPIDPDQEWLDFLEALTAQAAIAIDNASLFNNLQRSNINLALAYDSTLEGWSKALDLRDKETEGHSQRVTDITIKIARAMGLSEAELVHVRRGALLHDIGKMGIPDSILLKPGRLSDEEWEIMRKHPVYAYELLFPIAFLRPALDIPYCHHEKWDGTGYPRGLKGEHIPLPARIFAVVDVWDALSFERPYRPAWPEEKIREYLLEQAGKHFDPKVVEVFLSVIVESEKLKDVP